MIWPQVGLILLPDVQDLVLNPPSGAFWFFLSFSYAKVINVILFLLWHTFLNSLTIVSLHKPIGSLHKVFVSLHKKFEPLHKPFESLNKSTKNLLALFSCLLPLHIPSLIYTVSKLTKGIYTIENLNFMLIFRFVLNRLNYYCTMNISIHLHISIC